MIIPYLSLNICHSQKFFKHKFLDIGDTYISKTVPAIIQFEEPLRL